MKLKGRPPKFPVELIQAVDRALDQGRPVRDIAKEFNVSKSWVNHRRGKVDLRVISCPVRQGDWYGLRADMRHKGFVWSVDRTHVELRNYNSINNFSDETQLPAVVTVPIAAFLNDWVLVRANWTGAKTGLIWEGVPKP